MMNPERVLRAFEQLIAAQLPSESNHPSLVVLEQERVRIILTRIKNAVQLDVEISGPSPENSIGDSDEARTKECRRAAMRSIELLEFVIMLVDQGFSLSLIDSEFLWTASIALIEPPNDTILKLLHPPTWEAPS